MADPRLVGTWDVDRGDERSVHAYGNVTMRFEPDGRLEYSIHTDGTDQVMHLTYRVEGQWIITDQPSHPRQQRNQYEFTPDGKLAVHVDPSQPPVLYVRR